MSTVDPAAERRAKQQRYVGQPGMLVAAVVFAVVQVGCAAVLGLGIGAMADFIRHSIIDSVFDDRDVFPDFWGPATMGIALTVGIIGTIAAAGLSSMFLQRYRGGEKQPSVLAPIGLVAVAVAVTIHAQSWTEPLEVGTQIDPSFHTDEDWGVFSWIAYYADIWLPALLIVIAVLVVWYAIKYNRRLRLQIANRNRLLTQGRRVAGTITQVTVVTSQNSEGHKTTVGADIVVKFTDANGTDRWVKRRSTNRSAMPGPGVALVLFDPLQPGDENSIFVAFTADPTPPDWIGTVA
ncbi:hypothetical protein [Kribbella sp. NPDC051718]|uniref:hypothetical protein n=1 Tax=Kribbella sp. NPDC051718 TaxID=3155168 RepID=UPI0034233084